MSYDPAALAALIGDMTGKLDQVIGLGALQRATYDLVFRFQSAPGANEIIDFFLLGSAYVLPAQMAGAIGFAGGHPVADYVLTLRAGGTLDPATGDVIGTITISPAGLFTFATVSTVETIVPKGSLIKLVGQPVVDAGLSGVTFAMPGFLSA